MKTFYLTRYGLGRDSTLGIFHAGDGQRICYSLEDERRRVKVPGETCIPEGTYELRLRTWGGFHERYAERFPDMHHGMIEILGVPGFTDILIHCGNTERDTRGCPLTGMTPDFTPSGDFQVFTSVAAYEKLYPLIAGPLMNDEPVFLTVHVREPE